MESLRQALIKRSTDAASLNELAGDTYFLQDVAALCACDGVLMYKNADDKLHPYVAPVAILPSAVPGALFKQSVELAVPFSRLIDRVACDLPWLQTHLATVCEVDEFTRGAMEVTRAVYGDKAGQRSIKDDIRLHILRSDYMVDQREGETNPRLLQVEINTIAASFGSLAAKVSSLHRAVLQRLAEDMVAKGAAQGPGRQDSWSVLNAVDSVAPHNGSLEGIAAGIGGAHQAYVARYGTTSAARMVGVLFVVPRGERNEADQRHLEFAVHKGFGARCRRVTFDELNEARAAGKLRLVDEQGVPVPGQEGQGRLVLSLEGGMEWEASVVYYRSGYAPEHYERDPPGCWHTRRTIEWAHAVKCPSAPAHLAGCKKVQALWNDPEQLAHFVSDPAVAQQLSRCFAAQGDPSMPSSQPLVDAALGGSRMPKAFVLKPQREGGGNNIYEDRAVREVLSAGKGLSQYILMERIHARPSPSLIFDRTHTHTAPSNGPAPHLPVSVRGVVRDTLSELGVYAIHIADGSRELESRPVGHLLRSKAADSDEGGVAAGFAVVDSPLLV